MGISGLFYNITLFKMCPQFSEKIEFSKKKKKHALSFGTFCNWHKEELPLLLIRQSDIIIDLY